jgi:hypothetical protein
MVAGIIVITTIADTAITAGAAIVASGVAVRRPGEVPARPACAARGRWDPWAAWHWPAAFVS